MARSSAPLNSAEAAAVLGVDVRTVERWVKTGRIKPVRKIGRGYVFTGEEIARVAALPRDRRGPKPRQPQDATLLFPPEGAS